MLREILEELNEKVGEGNVLTKKQRNGLIKIIDPGAKYKLENYQIGEQKGSDIIRKLKDDITLPKDEVSFNRYVSWDLGDTYIVRIGLAHEWKSFNQHGVEIPLTREEFSKYGFRLTKN